MHFDPANTYITHPHHTPNPLFLSSPWGRWSPKRPLLTSSFLPSSSLIFAVVLPSCPEPGAPLAGHPPFLVTLSGSDLSPSQVNRASLNNNSIYIISSNSLIPDCLIGASIRHRNLSSRRRLSTIRRLYLHKSNSITKMISYLYPPVSLLILRNYILFNPPPPQTKARQVQLNRNQPMLKQPPILNFVAMTATRFFRSAMS